MEEIPVEEGLYLTMKKVAIIHRRDELRAAKSIQEKAFEMKMHFMGLSSGRDKRRWNS